MITVVKPSGTAILDEKGEAETQKLCKAYEKGGRDFDFQRYLC